MPVHMLARQFSFMELQPWQVISVGTSAFSYALLSQFSVQPAALLQLAPGKNSANSKNKERTEIPSVLYFLLSSIIFLSASIASDNPPIESIIPHITASSPSIIEPTSVAISSGRIISSLILSGAAFE